MLENLQPIWIDSPAGVEGAVRAVRSAGQLALDTEADSLHSYFHKTCLIQVTADGGNFVIDPLAIDPEALGPLWEQVEAPDVPVLMHGADYDLRVLDRDFGVRIRGLKDTQIMAQLLGEPKTGLAALLGKEAGVELDKRHQRADWGRRPLTRSQVRYAAADTAFLSRLADRLRSRLEELGRWEWAEEEFRRLEQVRFTPPTPDPLAFERVKGVRALKGTDRDRAFSLFDWRESEARRLDTPPFKVMGNSVLVTLAREAPGSPSEMAKLEGIGPRFVRRWGRQVLREIRRPDRAPERSKIPREPDPSAVVVRRIKRLVAVRDEVAAQEKLEPGLVCSRGCAVAVASFQPRCSTEEHLEAAGLTGWRLELLGDRFLTALKET
jgi:ribonuclease D